MGKYYTRKEAYKVMEKIIQALPDTERFGFVKNEYQHLLWNFNSRDSRQAYDSLDLRSVNEYFNYFKEIVLYSGIQEPVEDGVIIENSFAFETPEQQKAMEELIQKYLNRINAKPSASDTGTGAIPGGAVKPQTTAGNFVNVARNTQKVGIAAFYNRIANISREGYLGDLSCGKFVYDMICDELEGGKDIVKKIFTKTPIEAVNTLFEKFPGNKNLKRIPAATDDDLKTVQAEADKGTLILAVFRNKTVADARGEYHGHIAFVGCSSLTLETKPQYMEGGKAIYKDMIGTTLPEATRLVLVQGGYF
jgi:hypothetical protein